MLYFSTWEYLVVLVPHVTTVIHADHAQGFLLTIQSLFDSLQQVFYFTECC